MLEVAGCEFAFVDMEHSGFGFETVKALLRHLHDCGIATVLRPPSKADHHIARACDVGAQGLIPPMLETEAQAKALARQIKYPPQARGGRRSASPMTTTGRGRWRTRWRTRMRPPPPWRSSRSADGVRNAGAIAAVEGIDCLWIGHFDLSNSLGIPGEFGSAAFKDAVRTVMDAGAANGLSVGRLAGSPDEAEALFAQGCDFICYSGDVWLFTGALSQGVAAVRDRIGDAVAGGR